MRCAGFLLVAGLALAPASARAQEAQGPTRWYGWQVMLADATVAGLTLGLATVETDTGSTGVALGVAALAAFALVPPAIHLAHGSPHDALLSFTVRTAPLALGVLLFGITTAGRPGHCAEGCSELILPFAGAVGSGIGMIYDWVALSSEPVPALAVAPFLGPGGRGQGLGVAMRW